MLDLNQIALFVQVARAGSFAEAARRLGMPTTTLSRQILQLEEHLQLRLLQRSTRKLTLTDAGRALFERSAYQVEDIQSAALQLTSERLRPTGTVRIAAPADFFDFYLMDWVAEFLQAHPDVKLEFVLSDGIADVISDGIDIAFRGGELPSSSLIARKLSTAHFSLAASAAYLKARGTPDTLQTLADHDCIRSTRANGRTLWRLVGPQGPEEVEVSGPFCANTVQAQMKAAMAGLGICLLPQTMLLQGLHSGQLVKVLPDHIATRGGFYMVFPSRKQMPRAVSAFADLSVRKLSVLQALTA